MEETTSDEEMLQIVEWMVESKKSPLQVECSGFEISKNQSLIQKKVIQLLIGVFVVYEHKVVEYITLIFFMGSSLIEKFK